MNELPALRIADIKRELHDLKEMTGVVPRIDLALVAIEEAQRWVTGWEETKSIHYLLKAAEDLIQKIDHERVQHVEDLKMELYYLYEYNPNLKPETHPAFSQG